MYEGFFGLKQHPFSLSADARFIFLSAQHREAAAGLIYAVVSRKGIVTLTGKPGVGKTTVLNAAVAAISRASIRTAYVGVPSLTADEFLELVMRHLGLPVSARSNKAERLVALERFLRKSNAEGRPVALMVDEAHVLGSEVLEEIRLLTNFESGGSKLLQVVLAGQEDLDVLLRRPDMTQIRQRIACRLTLDAMNETETREYVAHRWAKAGASSDQPFDGAALRALFTYSQGVPRLLNALCDNALLMAFGEGKRAVLESVVLAVARDLDLPADRDDGMAQSLGVEGVDDIELVAAAVAMGQSQPVPNVAARASRRPLWLVRSMMSAAAPAIEAQNVAPAIEAPVVKAQSEAPVVKAQSEAPAIETQAETPVVETPAVATRQPPGAARPRARRRKAPPQ